jgi:GntP family gluconate:H+ symporter
MSPILILLVGIVTVVGAIVVLRLNAFLALLIAALLVSLLSPGEPASKVSRVAEALGTTAGSIGIVIALAAIIGKAMMDSGAADRIVLAFLRLLGEERASTALMSSGFILAVPVFFDTVFYLLVPLARSMYERTGRHYLRYLLAIAAGGVATHTLVPPTPGPLVIAGTLGVDLGVMLVIGTAVALPAAFVGLLAAHWMDRRMPIPLRVEASGVPDPEPVRALEPPGLLVSILPIILPVVLIAGNTVVTAAGGAGTRLATWFAVIGNPNLALLLATAIALAVYQRQRRPTPQAMAAMVEESLMSAGVIILITAAGGAFGAMLKEAGIGPAIQAIFETEGRSAGLVLLFLAFALSSLLKFAQGSSTVAMITAAGMFAAMLAGSPPLPFHRVYLATAIGAGALFGSWMNDSGFWIFTKMGGLTEVESLKSWTPLLAIVGVTAMAVTVALAMVVPMG